MEWTCTLCWARMDQNTGVFMENNFHASHRSVELSLITKYFQLVPAIFSFKILSLFIFSVSFILTRYPKKTPIKELISF